MTLPFPADQVVACFKDDLPEVAASDAPYWTRLKVPPGLPVFKDDRPWAEAIMAHFNPTSGRCFAVALAREDFIPHFLLTYPDGIGTGTPNDEEFAAEIKASRQLTCTRVEAKGIVVLNELEGFVEPGEPGEYEGPDGSCSEPEEPQSDSTDGTEEVELEECPSPDSDDSTAETGSDTSTDTTPGDTEDADPNTGESDSAPQTEGEEGPSGL